MYILYIAYVSLNVLLYLKKLQIKSLWLVDSITGESYPIQQWKLLFEIEPILTCLVAFCLLVGAFVFGFTIYSLYLVLMGCTSIFCFNQQANEEIKWADLQSAIDGGHITQISRILLEYNENYPNIYQHKACSEDNEMVPLNSVKQLRNIYDEGMVSNLSRLFFSKYQTLVEADTRKRAD